MAQESPGFEPDHDETGKPPTPRPAADPWKAFGYVVAGVLFYGAIGWLADRFLGTSFLVAVGIILGAGLGVFMTWRTFRVED